MSRPAAATWSEEDLKKKTLASKDGEVGLWELASDINAFPGRSASAIHKTRKADIISAILEVQKSRPQAQAILQAPAPRDTSGDKAFTRGPECNRYDLMLEFFKQPAADADDDDAEIDEDEANAELDAMSDIALIQDSNEKAIASIYASDAQNEREYVLGSRGWFLSRVVAAVQQAPASSFSDLSALCGLSRFWETVFMRKDSNLFGILPSYDDLRILFSDEEDHSSANHLLEQQRMLKVFVHCKEDALSGCWHFKDEKQYRKMMFRKAWWVNQMKISDTVSDCFDILPEYLSRSPADQALIDQLRTRAQAELDSRRIPLVYSHSGIPSLLAPADHRTTAIARHHPFRCELFFQGKNHGRCCRPSHLAFGSDPVNKYDRKAQVAVAAALRKIAQTTPEKIPRTWAELDAFANQLVVDELPSFGTASSPDAVDSLQMGNLQVSKPKAK